MTAPVEETQKTKRTRGGMFLFEELQPEDIFTVEDFSSEQKQIAQMSAAFAEEKILPQSAAIEAKDYAVSVRLMRELGELGLLGVEVPEEYGGLELDKVTSALITTNVAVQGSFGVTFSGHAGIGTLPLVWYGTPEQRSKYLPKLASGEWIAAYALSESSAGSDAMNIRTRAVLSEDGKHYVLNGEKMWITNAAIANLFTIFAKIDGEKFSAFLVEAGTAGLSVGPEEHKLGIRGSSTCPLILNECKVPVANLLGHAGKGHQIAFNILNVGRYKLAANAVGASRYAFRNGVRYARERVAFGKPITSFGLVKEKIADSAAGMFALEATLFRVVGAIDRALADLDKNSPTYTQEVQKRIEEFAVECSILKVFGSETVDRVVDHMLQLHGGCGYVEEFPAERSYRDARINRIFEGTNEINRVIITTWTMKRAAQGALPLISAIAELMQSLSSGDGSGRAFTGPLANAKSVLASTKKIGLFCFGLVSHRFGNDMAEQQELVGALADILLEALVLESAVLRAEKMALTAPIAVKLAEYYAGQSFREVQDAAERILAATLEGEELAVQVATLRKLAEHRLIDTIGAGRVISAHMVEAGQYAVLSQRQPLETGLT